MRGLILTHVRGQIFILYSGSTDTGRKAARSSLHSSYEHMPYISAFYYSMLHSVMVSYSFLVKTFFVYVWDLGDTRVYRHLGIGTQGV